MSLRLDTRALNRTLLCSKCKKPWTCMSLNLNFQPRTKPICNFSQGTSHQDTPASQTGAWQHWAGNPEEKGSMMLSFYICKVYTFNMWGLLSGKCNWLNQLLFFKGQLPLIKYTYFHKHTVMHMKRASIQSSNPNVLQPKATETSLLHRHYLQKGKGPESRIKHKQPTHENSWDTRFMVGDGIKACGSLC